MNTETLEQYIKTGDLPGLTSLLNEYPAMANAVTSHGVSPIMLACYYRKPEVSALIMSYLKELTLFEAAAIGKFDAVTYLIYKHPEMVDQFSPDGFTALGLACFFGQADIARFLVLKGAAVNVPAKNSFMVYPVHSAVAAGQMEITRMLIDNGADVNVKQQSGATPLHSAAQNGNLEMLILLLEHGADAKAKLDNGKLPADLARDKGFTEIAEILGN